ncbi:hypothetical protein [Pseudomonas syringae]|uniref:hypothetical protein n=1 Tax=Pseudomonas syringae TaxID=317 RepID=UPI001F2D2A61|nr:hypothetical protein [Pseudomonas syringae]MCF5371281.1 hypothetical protein [Pseudomonas syringae]
MISNASFAGSTGTMDVPAPDWIEADPELFSQWGMFLLAMIKHGTVEATSRDQSLPMRHTEFGLLIEGGIYALDEPAEDDGRRVLIHFHKRGDLFISAISPSLPFQLNAHCRTTCLVIREQAIEHFKADFPAWDRLIPVLRAGMAQNYSRAISAAAGRDQDRILRVLSILAAHPTAIETKLGREIEAGKQRIRELAGVQKRSASRAFQALENAGYVSFYGYKRIFYREPQSEGKTFLNQHQQTGAVCQ